jgi:hypothetical protein
MSNNLYTVDGSESLEKLIHDTCCEISKEIASFIPSEKIQALALAGGYGRGEGGVLRTPAGDAPYNDLEFFLFLQGSPRLNERRFGAAMHQLEKKMTAKIGIDVEFKISNLEAFASGQTTMFSYDLVKGHKIFMGLTDALSYCRAHADAASIPPHEATRLLMNRCSGLLFAKDRLTNDSFTSADADFCARNIAKAQLAIGDALLAIHGYYDWSCRARNQRLTEMNDIPLPMEEIIEFHRIGVAFKLHPHITKMGKDELLELHQKVAEVAWCVFRYVEEKRLRKMMPSPAYYASSGNKCPETSAAKNALIRLRSFGLRGWKNGLMFRYPREALLNTLSLLLWDEKSAHQDWLSQQFVSPIHGWQDAMAAYQKLWSRYN